MDTFPIPIHRLARLSDLIFAVAMTLMALTFDSFPTAKMTPQEVTQFLQTQIPDLGVYALTFIIIASYWTTHLNQFKYYKSTDTIHLWLTLFSLLFVVLMPYANALSNYYDSVFAVQVFYSLTAASIGLFSSVTWIYATQERRLVAPDLDAQTIRQIRQESYVEPSISLLAIAGALIHPWGWFATFLLIPVIQFMQSQNQQTTKSIG
ncbi:TMEM175 family protein [Aliterella atlantica]|uniref:Membrane protein n=1 Tax=Aliterella atlantica CENA595 TaxID=1618023 RepID=A0A0D8ZPI7_9CYAN|nr:TMEM175 family protein [Aliterella atlantica]KJH70414.1 membrane protein [Aliterella atlantica CENA595]